MAMKGDGVFAQGDETNPSTKHIKCVSMLPANTAIPRSASGRQSRPRSEGRR